MLSLWSTPVGEYLFPAAERVNPELGRRVLSLYEATGAFGQGRAYPEFTHRFESGSFDEIDIRPHLGDELWAFLCAAVCDYLQSVRDGDYAVERRHFGSIWPNVSLRGEFHRPHRHNPLEHLVVGTYYVAVPGPSGRGAGALSLMDARASIGGSAMYRRFYSEGEVCLEPSPGYLVLFPPHVYHYVSPHASDEARISISFNVGLDVLGQHATCDARRFKRKE